MINMGKNSSIDGENEGYDRNVRELMKRIMEIEE